MHAFLYTHTVPVCPDFMVMDGTVTVNGDTATTVCEFGYFVSTGDKVRICRNQEWNGTQPVCSSKCILTYSYMTTFTG